jgi:hypothetical protein
LAAQQAPPPWAWAQLRFAQSMAPAKVKAKPANSRLLFFILRSPLITWSLNPY